MLNRDSDDARSLERTRVFVKLLADHGADIDASRGSDKPTALAEKIRVGDREFALLLLDVGARSDRLTAQQRDQLTALLASPARERPSPDAENCVAAGD